MKGLENFDKHLDDEDVDEIVEAFELPPLEQATLANTGSHAAQAAAIYSITTLTASITKKTSLKLKAFVMLRSCPSSVILILGFHPWMRFLHP